MSAHGYAFAPGPWRLSETHDFSYVKASDGTYVTQRMTNGGHAKQAVEQIRATAKLISAAPDLVDSLMTCLEELAAMGESGSPLGLSPPSHAYQKAEAALKKAGVL